MWISRFAVAYVDVANGFDRQAMAACGVLSGIPIPGGSGAMQAQRRRT